MIRETFGTNTALYHRKHYNRSGQLFDIRLGTDSSSSWDVEDPQVWQWANGSWNRGALRIYYNAGQNDYSGPNPAQADNNGNVYHMEHFVPTGVDGSQNITGWALGKDSYLYDELNRLTQVTETPTGGTGPGFTQKFIYDRWGNRKIDIAATSNVGGGVTDIDFKVLTANNRLVAPSDTTGDDLGTDLMRYDKAGNLVYDNYSPAVGQRGSMTYDAENRMLTAVNNSHQYRYDADGKRTRKLVAGSVEMWLVYGVNGELVAEYDATLPGGTLKKEYGYRGGQMLVVYDSTLLGDNRVKWMVTDHLGSTRMLVNQSGGLCGAIERRDYLPFGEELASTIGHRNAACSGYVVTPNPRQKFTGKDRDNETGLDFFEARYHSSAQGRFLSPDEFAGGPTELFAEVAAHNPTFYADIAEPQSLNKYAYCLNNPFKFVDPDGHQTKMADPMLQRFTVNYWANKLDNAEKAARDTVEAVGKEIDNVRIGIKNQGNIVLRAFGLQAEDEEFHQPSNELQAAVMATTSKELFLAGGASRGGQFNVMMAEAKQTAGITTMLSGVKVVDKFAGALEGTVNLKPTLDRINSGGKFPHKNDGSVFQNKEGLLPTKPKGYYTEYVVPTPGTNKAGVQRIIKGQGGEYYYTSDHYQTFIPLNR
jgi:RHS repeat-associated protein